jgi:hypothetical protein
MNTKLVTGVTVMVLLIGLASNSLIGSAFAVDAKGLDNKTKTDTKSLKGSSDVTKSKDGTNIVNDKTKSGLPHAMTKQEGQKLNRDKQTADESAKLAKDKEKSQALVKASQGKSKTGSTDKSKGTTKNDHNPPK